jgi:predicted Zn-dependent protease
VDKGMHERLEAMLAAGQDSPLLRFSLGAGYRREGRLAEACRHLESAVQQDPQYSAAWKLLGCARAEAGNKQQAQAAFHTGIDVATARGDVQAAKEMRVFLKRLEKSTGNDRKGD